MQGEPYEWGHPPGAPDDAPAEGAPPADAPEADAWRRSAREAIMDGVARRVDELLDAATEPGAPPEELAGETVDAVLRDDPAGPLAPEGCDLLAMWSAMTALTQEVKLQGRSFKDLSRELAPLGDLGESVREALAAHDEAMSLVGEAEGRAAGESQRAAARAARREIIDGLLDARDGLARALAAADEHRLDAIDRIEASSWLARRWLRRVDGLVEASASVADGCAISLARMDDLLSSLGVARIDAEGEPFDPRRMRAVDVDSDAGLPEGTVLEVYRPGYEWDGEMLRPCEVRVAGRGR